MKYVEGHFQEVTGNGSEQLLELPEVTPDRIIAVQAWMSVKGDSRTWRPDSPWTGRRWPRSLMTATTWA